MSLSLVWLNTTVCSVVLWSFEMSFIHKIMMLQLFYWRCSYKQCDTWESRELNWSVSLVMTFYRRRIFFFPVNVAKMFPRVTLWRFDMNEKLILIAKLYFLHTNKNLSYINLRSAEIQKRSLNSIPSGYAMFNALAHEWVHFFSSFCSFLFFL